MAFVVVSSLALRGMVTCDTHLPYNHLHRPPAKQIAEWLFANGVCNPEAFGNDGPDPYAKEAHFFDHDFRFKGGIDYYTKRYQHCIHDNNVEYIMDATPETLFQSKRVHNFYEQVAPGSAASLKIFIILREPVAREMSLYNHKASEFKRTQDMEAWFSNVADDDGNVMSFDEYTTQLKYYAMPFFSWQVTGFYVNHLREWIKWFDREQILVLSYDEVQNNPEMVEWRISQFLGKQFTGKLPRANVRGDAPVTKEKRTLPKQAGKFLIPLFHDKNEELYEFLEAHPGPPMEQRPFPRFEEYSLEELVE